MFQCFVDDRYDAHSKANNLEVLYFDESIDASHGKQTPFLNDTSQAHQPQNKVVAIGPNTTSLPSSSFVYPTNSRFPALSPVLFGEAREVKALSEATVQNKVDLSKMNMKFFTEKRLYSQHFHSLRLRSNKQDLAFKDIVRYLKAAQFHDESNTIAFDKLCGATVDNDTIETGTSVDAPWQSLKKFVSKHAVLEADCFKSLREEVCSPLFATASSAEHALKILFQEANILEHKASAAKAVVERAKSISAVRQAKYEALKKSLSNTVLSQSDIHRLVAAQSEAEDAALDQDETETTFQTVVSEYETRMPEIIKSIRRLNSERISTFKRSMLGWTVAKRQLLSAMMQNLEKLSGHVTAIDAERDLVKFSEGTTDFWNIATRRESTAVSKDPSDPLINASLEYTPITTEIDASLESEGVNGDPLLLPSLPALQEEEDINDDSDYEEQQMREAAQERSESDASSPTPITSPPSSTSFSTSSSSFSSSSSAVPRSNSLKKRAYTLARSLQHPLVFV